MNSQEKKRFIVGIVIGIVISTAIFTVLQYFFSTGNSSPLKNIVGSIIFALVYTASMYWLFTRKKKKQQTQNHQDSALH
ncbi:hypothetical protein KRX19_02145 [Cardiobacteriaceae bacterium TAE3-ERU3]|nr:hypothetical protein [Cardiobacteriaceae bacterium TAE3-ERU3]